MKNSTYPIDGSRPLSDSRQEMFAQAFTGCPPCSASEAWRRAGYSKANADVKSARALVNVGIAARISYLRQQNAKACGFTKAHALAALSEIARGTATGTKNAPTVRDRIRAIDSLARICGWYEPEKVPEAKPKVIFNWSFPVPKKGDTSADATEKRSSAP